MNRRIWLFLGGVAVCTGVLYFAAELYERRLADLPVYGPVVEENGVIIEHVVPDFTMINQSGEKITRRQMQDKVSVVNFFFTSCPTICPKMMRNMQTVQEMYLNQPDVTMLSFSVDPKRDDPARLAKYADAYHIDENRWNLLTGSKKEIYALARNGFYLSASQGEGGDHDFIHSENLVLIDRVGRIRGYYEGTDKTAVDRLISDIAKLKRDKS